MTVVPGSSEMGPGILTGLSQRVAEELDLDWAQVRAEHAPTSILWPNPCGNPFFGAQLTGGSTSTRGWYPMLRDGGMPDVAVAIVPSEAAPAAVGEVGVPCVAPAVENAWARLTGTRQCSLTFYPGSRMGEA